MAERIHAGTSGWHYAHWRGPFYPETLRPGEMLGYYAERFATVEINNSFYHLPSRETFREWRAGTPARFTFAVKASRYITGEARVRLFRQRSGGIRGAKRGRTSGDDSRQVVVATVGVFPTVGFSFNLPGCLQPQKAHGRKNHGPWLPKLRRKISRSGRR